MRYEDYNKTAQKAINLRVVPIYNWLKENKPNWKKEGMTSLDFAHVVPFYLRKDSECFPKNMKRDSYEYKHYSCVIHSLKKQGFLKSRPIPGTHRSEYIVNEECLPSSITGIHTIPQLDLPIKKIPMAEPVPDTPTPAIVPQPAAAQAFFEAELKQIKVQSCKLGASTQASAEFLDVTLWDIYKIGLAMQSTLGTEYMFNVNNKAKETSNETNQSVQEVLPQETLLSTVHEANPSSMDTQDASH